MVAAEPEPTRRSLLKSDRRSRLLAAAARQFAERGFAAVRLEDIGAAVDVSGPAIYRHFPNKEALVVGGAVAPLFDLAGEPAAALVRIGAVLLLVALGLWLAFRALRLEKGWASRLKLPAPTSSRVVEPARGADAGAKAPNLIERVIQPRPRAEPDRKSVV